MIISWVLFSIVPWSPLQIIENVLNLIRCLTGSHWNVTSAEVMWYIIIYAIICYVILFAQIENRSRRCYLHTLWFLGDDNSAWLVTCPVSLNEDVIAWTFSARLAICEGGSTGHRRISLTKGQWCGVTMFSYWTPEQTFELLMIWDSMTPMCRHCNVIFYTRQWLVHSWLHNTEEWVMENFRKI